MKRVILVLLVLRASAHADQLRVWLDIDPCVGDARAELERVIRVEVGDSLANESDAGRDVPRATVRCESAGVVLHVDDPITYRSVWRRIGEPVEPRLVALALVELVAASRSELAAPSTPPAFETRPLHDAMAPASHPWRSLRTQMSAGALRFSAMDQMLLGARLRLSAGARGAVGWMVDAEAHGVSQTRMLGVLSIRLFGVGAAAQLQLGEGRARVNLGLGARGGAVHMSGMAGGPNVQGAAFWSRWFGPMALATVGYAITRRVTIDTAVETGYVVSPVRALVGSESAAAIDGVWLQFHAGVGVQL